MKRQLAAVIAITALISNPTLASFNDVSDAHLHKAAIEYVQTQGIVSGYPDGTYKPETKLDRAAFSKIVIGSRYSMTDIDSCLAANGFYSRRVFSDVEAGTWYERYFCLGKKTKIMTGYSDGSVKPTSIIIFSEAAKILALSYALNVRAALPSEPWFTPFVEKLAELGAIPDSLNDITDPILQGTREITRGEMADMIYRMRSVNDTISAADGSFSVKIPSDALPDGIDPITLKIIRLAASQNPVQEVNGAPMVFYKLEPEGLVFKKPVRFTINTETQANTIPLVFLVSGDSFDLLPDPSIEIDQENQTAILAGEMNHFSQVGFAGLPLSVAAGDTAGDGSLSASITIPTPQLRFTNGHQDLTISGIQLEQSFFADGDGRLNPATPSNSDNPLLLMGSVPCSSGPSTTAELVLRTKISYQSTRNDQPAYNDYLSTLLTQSAPDTDAVFFTLFFIHVFKKGEPICKNRNDFDCPGAIPGNTEIQVLNIGGACYPVGQFRFATKDKCNADHWHGAKAVALDGTTISDTQGTCGFGKVSEIPSGTISISAEQASSFPLGTPTYQIQIRGGIFGN